MANDEIWGAGKWKGTPVSELPQHYLEWCVQNMDNDKYVRIASRELAARGAAIPDRKEKNPADEIADRLLRKIGGLELQMNDMAANLRKLLNANGIDAPPPPEVKTHGVGWYGKEDDKRDNFGGESYRESKARRNEEFELDESAPF